MVQPIYNLILHVLVFPKNHNINYVKTHVLTVRNFKKAKAAYNSISLNAFTFHSCKHLDDEYT